MAEDLGGRFSTLYREIRHNRSPEEAEYDSSQGREMAQSRRKIARRVSLCTATNAILMTKNESGPVAGGKRRAAETHGKGTRAERQHDL